MAAGALKNMLSSETRIIRDGNDQLVSGQEIVPGDILILSLGDRIPADKRLFLFLLWCSMLSSRISQSSLCFILLHNTVRISNHSN